MHKASGLLLLLTVTACGGGEESAQRTEGQDLRTFDVTESATDASSRAPGAPPAPPGVSPTAAPGVAFDYRYAFRLPPRRIGEVQEQHAVACEKLGTDKCRITGMVYELRGDDDVDAQLAFKLDPALARRFGKEGIDAVVRAEGELRRAQITGTDVGTQIDEGRRSQGQIEEELRRVEQQLARPGLGSSERAELQAQAQSLRAQLRGGQQMQTTLRAQLATTPMVFNYEAGETDRTLKASAQRSLDRFLTSLGFMLVFVVYALPWVLLVLAAILGARWVRRRFLKDEPAPSEEAAVTPPAA